ncbi:MAG TPA: hypothetical protein PKG48_02200 [Bacteroidales bacterium]|nr:hypothetical protein [Bacteroidales bacterium]HPS61990.1 hypothetical protein [Bacteroidales bacterium]
MERPINIKPRQDAILKTLLACCIVAAWIGYHVLVSRSVFHIEKEFTESLAPPAQTGK